jgi:hypothetical protein
MSRLEDTAYNYGAKIKGRAMSDNAFYEAAYDAAEAECKALRAENDRLREALEWVGGTVGATDEWPDQETMIASVKRTAEDVVVERDRLREALERIANSKTVYGVREPISLLQGIAIDALLLRLEDFGAISDEALAKEVGQ